MSKKIELDDKAIIKKARKMANSRGLTCEKVFARIEDELQLPNDGPMNLESLCRVYYGVLRYKEWSLIEDWGDHLFVKVPLKSKTSGRSD